MQYALKYQQHLKALVISNMVASTAAYNRYAQKVLIPQMNPEALARILTLQHEGKTGDPAYEQLLMANDDTKHILRMPPDQWPDPVMRTRERVNNSIYTLMQGPSEMGLSGRLANWDVSKRLPDIRVPTLVIGSRYGTMDPTYMKWMAQQLPRGHFLYCAKGSHLAMYHDQKTYMHGIIAIIEDVDAGSDVGSAKRNVERH